MRRFVIGRAGSWVSSAIVVTVWSTGCAGLLDLDDIEFREGDDRSGGASGTHNDGGAIGTHNDSGAGGTRDDEGGGAGGSIGIGGAGDGGAAGASDNGSGGTATGGARGGSAGESGAAGNAAGSDGSGATAGMDATGGAAGSGGRQDPPQPVLETTPLPVGHGVYCSMREPSEMAFDLAWDDEPCATIMARTGWQDDDVERAGIIDTVGRNFVVMRCPIGNMLGLWTWTQPGTYALDLARARALDAHANTGCVFTVSPQRLPVFSAPFSLDPLPAGFQMSNRGYDFAAVPGSPNGVEPLAALDVTLYSERSLDPSSCTPSSAGCALAVSYRGQDRSAAPEDDHQGFTWAMNAGARVLAIASGEVFAKRARPVTGCHTPEQNELYVRHLVGSSLDSPYAESFVTYYAHLDFAPDLEVGSVVERGDVLGYVGNSGCTEGQNQLHLAILRTSNTARDYRPALDTTPGVYGPGGASPDDSVARIDPWGWMASQARANIDPGGYAWYHRQIPFMGRSAGTRLGGGALSIALWIDGEAPPRPCDENDRDWVVEGGKIINNPFAHCSL